MSYKKRVRNDETCTEDHNTADNATWYGGDRGHDFESSQSADSAECSSDEEHEVAQFE